MQVILGPQNSPINFMGLSGLPMKVKFIDSLTFLLYGPEHQADIQGSSVPWCPKRSPFPGAVLLLLDQLCKVG